jgi:Domain of unknown function (DUF1906)
MATLLGADYAFSPHPTTAALKAAGVHFVARYLSSNPVNDTNGKNLLPAEAHALLAAGIKIVVVAEEGAGMMLGGRPAGVSTATHANAVVKAIGMPGIPVYFACDFDAPEGDQPAINAFLDGATQVIGHGRTGLYGGYWPLSRARAAGKASYFWGTIAWSGDRWLIQDNPQTFTPHIMQGLQMSIGGVSVDVDHSYLPDFGQWPRPAAPAPPPAAPFSWHGDGKTSLAQLAAAHGTSVQKILWETASHNPGGYPLPRVAAYIDAGNWHSAVVSGAGPFWVG